MQKRCFSPNECHPRQEDLTFLSSQEWIEHVPSMLLVSLAHFIKPSQDE